MSRETPLFPVQDSSIRESLEDITKRLALIESLGVIERTIWLASPSRVYTSGGSNAASTWVDLDLSSYTTDKTKLVIIEVELKHSAAGQWIGFRKNGDTPSYILHRKRNELVNTLCSDQFIIGCDNAQVIEWQCTQLNADEINIDVLGYIEQVEVS